MDEIDEALQYVRAPGTKYIYRRNIETFLQAQTLLPHEFLELARRDPKAASTRIVKYVTERASRRVGCSTAAAHFCAVKAFLEYNDVVGLNWKKMRKVLPSRSRHGDDRAPTPEEVRMILKACSTRFRAVVLLMASGGVRIGSFDYFLLRDYEVLCSGSAQETTAEAKTPKWQAREGGKVLAGKLIVYRGEPEEYSTFVSPEAVEALKDYLELRKRGGEKLNPASPLIRDEWNWRGGHVQEASRLGSRAMNKEIQLVLAKAGLKVREFKQAHGFRKFFKTRCEMAMKSAYVEILMGHSLGVSDSYLKPTEKELLDEYLKAVPFLTIQEADELKRELSKKDEEVSTLRREVSSIATTLQLMQLELQELRRRKG